ncbi:hypothetical protein [Paenibacillus naphthalenovorans]|uniref:Uncharacterized protein n=1 Tax=Paenibacillus naphthalenovorans TaxID=162209 RepID=A0A0U2UJC6_9BACL|nr:hypothetical protein [Paenibacillus naphthalenovorans]ALS22001.1 hypothetical protein IJ22_16250 [Paenibacillus naphthalenovorans]
MEGVLGVHGPLLQEVQMLLKLLSIQSLLFPWIDFLAGKCMLLGKTKPIMASKMVSVLFSVALLILFVFTIPHLNGGLTGLAAAIAAPLEQATVYVLLHRLEKQSDPFLLNRSTGSAL